MVDDLLHDVDALAVRGMGFAREEQGHGTIRGIQDAVEAVNVGEEQVGALIGREAPAEADEQGVRRELRDGRFAVLAAHAELLVELGKPVAQDVEQIGLHGLPGAPDDLVRDGGELVPARGAA